jgi:hypothetical protein
MFRHISGLVFLSLVFVLGVLPAMAQDKDKACFTEQARADAERTAKV